MLTPTLSTVMGQDIYDVGQFIVVPRGTDKSWEWVQVVGKTQEMGEAQKAERLFQSIMKCWVKITQK